MLDITMKLVDKQKYKGNKMQDWNFPLFFYQLQKALSTTTLNYKCNTSEKNSKSKKVE